jgi:hypothetical protein
MATPRKAAPRVAIRGRGWTQSIHIDGGKYRQVARTILRVLGSEPIAFTELARRVGRGLPGFEGSVAWYTVVVARRLEAEGRIARQGKPVRYLRPRRHAR